MGKTKRSQFQIPHAIATLIKLFSAKLCTCTKAKEIIESKTGVKLTNIVGPTMWVDKS